MKVYHRTLKHVLRDTIAIIVVMAISFLAGYIYHDGRRPPELSGVEKIIKLHSYMRGPIVQWAWRQAYCGKQTWMDELND